MLKEIHPNRIDGTLGIPFLLSENLRVSEWNEATIEVPLNKNHLIEIGFNAPDGHVDTGWIDIAAGILSQLNDIDNQAQARGLVDFELVLKQASCCLR